MKRGTPDHPKTRMLAARLNLKRYQAVGLLESLWHFAASYAKRGDIGKWSNSEIAAAIDWEGDPDELITALVASNFLDECDEFRLLVHDWKEHADQTVMRSEEVKKLGFASIQLANASRKLKHASQPTPTPEPTPKPEPKPKPNTICSEPALSASELEREVAGGSPFTFPVIAPDSKPKTWTLPAAKLAEYRQTFSGLNVEAELAKAVQWCRDNPKKRKTAGGMMRFCFGWLERNQNRGSPPIRNMADGGEVLDTSFKLKV